MKNAVILGAGPSLPMDFAKYLASWRYGDGVPELVSVNGHAAKHFAHVIKCDYMVFLDEPDKQIYPMDYEIKKFSPCLGDECPKFWNSGVLAAWLGCQLADKVYLCGFDMFERGKPRYFYGGDIVQGSSKFKGVNAWKEGWKHLDESKIVIISENLKHVLHS